MIKSAGVHLDGTIGTAYTSTDRLKQLQLFLWHSGRFGVQVRVVKSVLNKDSPATCSMDVQRATAQAADSLHLRKMMMVSHAYHDALFMAKVAPTGVARTPHGSTGTHMYTTTRN